MIALALLSMLIVAGAELGMGRSLFGPDGRFGWWESDIWSSENSQRVADAYTFSHVCHGMLTYGLLFLLARRLPLQHRYLVAVAIECGWEILENSPIIINRYRQATIAIGYDGDSVLNSACDVLFMSVGFLIAHSAVLRTTILLVVVMELGCLFWVRDNLTLNVIMLVRPVEAIKIWQAAGRSG